MPAAEVEIDIPLIRGLLVSQQPDLADQPIEQVAFGWDNVSFRIGSDLVARLPRRAVAAELIANEARWLPDLAPRLPLPVPVPVFLGEPGRGYPWQWLLAPLLSGQPASHAVQVDYRACAEDLGAFLAALHLLAPEEAPTNPYRGGPLSDRDRATRERLEILSGEVEVDHLQSLWERALSTPGHEGDPVWLHGDPHPGNLMIDNGRLSGVIDFGDITAGDPATDLAIVWTLLPADHREVFWLSYGGGGKALRMRARGWALSLGTAYLAHSADNPTMAAIGERTLRAVQEDD